ncbi:MAG: sulfatase-like hydrolase/transferase, partial [Armatimonadota bacterium]
GQTSHASDRLAPEPLLETVSSWLDEGPATPFLAYVHFIPPHMPYRAPERMVEQFASSKPPNAWHGSFAFDEIEPHMRNVQHPPLEEWVNQYDANLLWADWAVGELERLLREAGALDTTIFVITSDHGEAFGEHGYTYHGRGVYDEVVRIPLIVRLPGEAPGVRRVRALTQTVDVLPTLLDLLRMAYPREDVQGRSLLPLLAGQDDQVHDYVYARAEGDPPSYLVRDHRWALVLYQGGAARALYDLDADPRQTHNVIAEHPEILQEMLAAFADFCREQALPPLDFLHPSAEVPQPRPAPFPQFSEEEREELRALGYLE